MGEDAAPSITQQLLACLTYAGVAICLSFVTKSLFSVYELHAPFFVFAIQLAVSLLVTSLMMAFPQLAPTPMPRFDMAVLKESALQSTIFVGSVVVGFMAIGRVNIPLFLCLRRTTLLFVLAGEYIVLHKVTDRTTAVAVLVMTLGALVAGADGLTTDGSQASGASYIFVFMNNGLQALYLNVMKKFTSKHGIKSFGLVFYQSVVAFPLALVAVIAVETDTLRAFEHWQTPGLIMWMSLSAVLGVVYTYAITWCNSVTSPLGVSVTGAIKDLLLTLGSIVYFGGFVPTLAMVSGLALSFVGSVIYSLNKVLGKTKVEQRRPSGSDVDQDKDWQAGKVGSSGRV